MLRFRVGGIIGIHRFFWGPLIAMYYQYSIIHRGIVTIVRHQWMVRLVGHTTGGGIVQWRGGGRVRSGIRSGRFRQIFFHGRPATVASIIKVRKLWPEPFEEMFQLDQFGRFIPQLKIFILQIMRFGSTIVVFQPAHNVHSLTSWFVGMSAIVMFVT